MSAASVCCRLQMKMAWLHFHVFLYMHKIQPLTEASYEVTSTKFTRAIRKELSMSIIASVFMGFGVLFLMLWVGIYV